MLVKQEKRYRRHKRVRAKIFGTNQVPRLCVFRSNRHIYGQLIDDDKGKTIVSANDRELKKTKLKSKKSGDKKVNPAFEVGKLLAEKAKEKKISRVCFDRGGYKYHGQIKAIAEGAREGGLQF